MKTTIIYKDLGGDNEVQIDDLIRRDQYYYHDHEGKIEELERKLNAVTTTLGRLISSLTYEDTIKLDHLKGILNVEIIEINYEGNDND